MSNTVAIKVEGAGCQNCVNAIAKALNNVVGVTSASFDLAAGVATVEGEAELPALQTAIEDAGYDVV